MNQAIIKETSYSKIKDSIKKALEENLVPVVISNNDELTRKLFEKEENITVTVLLKNRKDKLYYRDSGFDEIMANFAGKNNNSLGIVFDELLEAEKLEKAKILARIKQNMKIAKKRKVKIKFIYIKSDKKDSLDLYSLGLVLGMDTKTARLASSQDF